MADNPGLPEHAIQRIRFLESQLQERDAHIERLQQEKQELAKQVKDLNKGSSKKPQQSRYWRKDEHERFLEALQKYGKKDVKAIAAYVQTRSPTQVRTHAQKWFLKQKRESEKKSNGGLDFGGDLSDDFDSGDDEEEDSPPIEAVKPNTRKRKAAAISTTTTNNAPTQTASPPPVPAPTQTASSNNTQQPSAAASAAPTAPSTSSGSLSQYSSFVPTYDASKPPSRANSWGGYDPSYLENWNNVLLGIRQFAQEPEDKQIGLIRNSYLPHRTIEEVQALVKTVRDYYSTHLHQGGADRPHTMAHPGQIPMPHHLQYNPYMVGMTPSPTTAGLDPTKMPGMIKPDPLSMVHLRSPANYLIFPTSPPPTLGWPTDIEPGEQLEKGASAPANASGASSGVPKQQSGATGGDDYDDDDDELKRLDPKNAITANKLHRPAPSPGLASFVSLSPMFGLGTTPLPGFASSGTPLMPMFSSVSPLPMPYSMVRPSASPIYFLGSQPPIPSLTDKKN